MIGFKLLNVENSLNNVLTVTSPKLRDKIDDNERGLFSEVIFGPTKDYKCACGKYKGVVYQGITCDVCGVTVQSSISRRFTFGKIKLDDSYFLVDPASFNIFMSTYITDKNERSNLIALVTSRLGWDIEKKTYIEITDNMYTGPMAFKESIFPRLKENIIKTLPVNDISNFELICKGLFTNAIPIIPPDLRPMIAGEGSTSFMDDTNKEYMVMLSYTKFINDSPIVPYFKLGVLQSLYFDLNEILLKKLSRKQGLIRKYILGKRVDYSGRAVIVPDPTLNLQEVDISFYIIKEIFKPALLPIFASAIGKSELEALNVYYDNSEYDNMLFEICKGYIGYPVILNRQPTLHRCGILVFFIRNIIMDHVIAISPIATEPSIVGALCGNTY